MITVNRYSADGAQVWNEFNASSKNGIFMFDRNYMDYHSDRFKDHSLLFWDDDELLALLPLSERNGKLFSHGGLTYGGFITGKDMKQSKMEACFDELVKYARENGFSQMTYKQVPHIYHKQPAEEDTFSLYARGASLCTVDVSTVINLAEPLKMSKGRKAQVARAKREGVEIVVMSNKESYDDYMRLEEEILVSRHGVRPAHTSSELKMLHDRFPENIHLYCALTNGRIIAGSVIYEYDNVVHTQYMAADEEARVNGALDLTIATVVEHYKGSKKWLDFGISTEHDRLYLNEGLAAQKESFGGRTGVYYIWQMNF